MKKAANLPICSPISHLLTSMDETTKKRMGKKFDICYVMAKENLAFAKYPALEARHGVDLGFAYKTKDSAKNFTHYIAESQRKQFIFSL